ncbi:TAXI family TRAP transporter solute-binding subunit [Actinokineospora iranica]|uniref:TRAP transporter solute receptor, TAXI family n=1 Tax=Actinokineospora iranica TaxID=1271860 RepID=A0A1G6Q7H7_9PSEU|nr:TAXI family TRAP transporter solute-binding subunit [Actinokineospora iranica]SDC88171.1 hypothetical protein SAMN05216174_105128 [Actinokineospora iranica]
MRNRVVLTAVAVALVAAGCGGKRTDTGAAAANGACETSDGRITIATGNTGGVYYTLGGGLAQLISDNTRLKATAAETGASVQNIQQLVAGDYDLAFSLADTAADAVNGTGAFEGKKANVRALARIYPNSTQVAVRTGSGIASVADMRGKKISTGSPKSGTEVIANRLLEAAGLNPATDVAAQRLALRPTVDGMKSGQIDGLFFSGGLPAPELTDLFTSMKGQVELIDVTPQLAAVQKISPVYTEGVIPSATYGLPTDVKTIEVPNMLLVREDLAAGDACAITRLIVDRKADLAKIHPAANGIDKATAGKTEPVPLHPGSQQALAG